MTLQEYRAFTENLCQNLMSDHRVVALVAVGSMTERDNMPNEWSDHDFFVITRPKDQEYFRTHFEWLPNFENFILAFRETQHGVKVVYKNGHLLEFAVFDANEIHLAKVNSYRILFDRGEIENAMQEVQTKTQLWSESSIPDDCYLFCQFLTNLLVGVGRYHRGERLSGNRFVKVSALKHLVRLIEKRVPSDNLHVLDNIDPFRRFEMVYPKIGAELDAILLMETPMAAKEMLRLAQRELKSRITDCPIELNILELGRYDPC